MSGKQFELLFGVYGGCFRMLVKAG